MTKTLIDVNDEYLRRAQQILGTATKKDTVNRSLGEIVRRDAAARFLALARSGLFGSARDA